MFERRLIILEKLLVKGIITYDELSKELHVSRETIRTDIQDLMRFYPVETVRGCNGGARMMKGYSLHRKPLAQKQIALLVRLRGQLDDGDIETLDSIILWIAAH